MGTVNTPGFDGVINSPAFHPETGVLFGSENFSPTTDLETINTTDGSLTTIGDLPDCFDGLIFSPLPQESGPLVIIPTLSQWGMIFAAIILGMFAVLRLRRKASE